MGFRGREWRNRARFARRLNLLAMERIPYHLVASAIADAEDAEARAAAAALAAAYHAIQPPIETVRDRMALLKDALITALERDAK